MKDKAQKLIEKYEELESELGNPDVLADQARYNKIHKQYKGIEKAVAKAKEYLQMVNDLAEYKEALGDPDPEMVAMAKAEISDIEKKLPGVTDELQILMVPKDPWDYRNATLEIRGGTGGDESALFAGDLFRMYQGYCSRMGWKMTIQDASEGTVGGYKEIRVFIEGDSVYGTLKFERAYVGSDGRHPPRSGRSRRGNPRGRHPHGYLPILGRGRPVHQQNGLRRATHPHPDGRGGELPDRT